MEIKGYLIQNNEGSYLSQDNVWFPHDKPEEARVHPEGQLANILAISRTWKTKPSRLTKATYSPEKGVQLVGEHFDLWA